MSLNLTPIQLDEASLSKTLNPPQYEAVVHFRGPQLILAGAGSGKTRVLTYKIAWLIREKGLRPWEILAVTFTNKAAQEMRARIANLIGYSANLRWVGTFHSICARFLRFHATRLGFTSNFTIYDTDDQKRLVKKLLKAEGFEDDMQFTSDGLRSFISKSKNLGQTPQEAKLAAEDRFQETMAHLYFKYQDGLQKNNAMDFDDLIFMAIRLLEAFPEVRQIFASGFRYILIDEYQDTNKAQYRLIRLLVGAQHNLVVVGDDDQSIYGWRGADITNILTFQKDFPEALITKLEQNYRSSSNILGVASSVIRNNKQRMEKTIWTDNAPGAKVLLLEQDDEILEAAYIARRIQEKNNFKPGETAVFYRTNSQSRVLEDELRRNRIPYLIVGGIRFYERKEVKDLLAYLHVVANPKDSVALARIINVPKRGLGEKSIQAIQDLANERGIDLFLALRNCQEAGISSGTAKRIQEFIALLDAFRLSAATLDLPDMVTEIINKTGYRAFLEEEGSDESLDRLSNIEELVSAAQDFMLRKNQAENTSNTNVTLPLTLDLDFLSGEIIENKDRAAGSEWAEPILSGGASAAATSESQVNPSQTSFSQDLDLFLQEIALVSDQDSLKASQEAVTLMTVHSAKGLEFPRVFVTGLEDGLFPMLRQGDDGDIEEERRLFYVAVTRARQELTLTFARRRRRFGTYQDAGGSRFFGEIDKQFLEIPRTRMPQNSFSRNYSSLNGNSFSAGSKFSSMPGNNHRDDLEFAPIPSYEDFSQESEIPFRKNQKVRHGKFGEGMIMAVEGAGESACVHVVFSDRIRRVLMIKFAKLEIL